MKGLKKFFKKVETLMAAVAFAEAGELETARQILRDEDRSNEILRKRADRDFAPRVAVRGSR